MSTRSIVATHIDGVVQGRYVHSDGYPEGVGAALQDIVTRDGLTTAVRTLLHDHYGWSSVDGEDAQARGSGRADGRFVAVPGYGIAYTTEQGQSSPEDWHSPGGDTWAEWAYVLTAEGMLVHIVESDNSWHEVGAVDYRDRAGLEALSSA